MANGQGQARESVMLVAINIADIEHPKHHGKSYRQVNEEKRHAIPIGSLVELSTGARLFVVYHARDCDQAPLYSLADDMEPRFSSESPYATAHWSNGYGEEDLKVIRSPKPLTPGPYSG